jgi:hypothetical protein
MRSRKDQSIFCGVSTKFCGGRDAPKIYTKDSWVFSQRNEISPEMVVNVVVVVLFGMGWNRRHDRLKNVASGMLGEAWHGSWRFIGNSIGPCIAENGNRNKELISLL